MDDRVVRVFVSSTFRDMHAERDYLNRFVFPELRARCLRQGWDFLGVDLRWGITEEEAEREGALALCLAEIERCRPFFVAFLGDRYGTVLPPAAIPTETFELALNVCTESERRIIQGAYRRDETAAADVYRLTLRSSGTGTYDPRRVAEFWERHSLNGRVNVGLSITAAEIEYAALNPQSRVPHCFFYIRRLQTSDQRGIPSALRPSSIEPTEHLKVKRLQKQVRGVKAVVRDYDAAVAGVHLDPNQLPANAGAADLPRLRSGALDVAGIEQWPPALREASEEQGVAELTGLEALGAHLIEDLSKAIEEYIHEHEAEGGSGTRSGYAAYQEAFVRQRTRTFIGRQTVLEILFNYVADSRQSAFLVVGDPGSGKSALLANFVVQCRSRCAGALVASHFIGASPDSTRLESVFAALCEQLGAPELDIQEMRTSALLAKRKFQSILRNAASEREVILVLDALDQLEAPSDIGPEAWLPFILPKGVHLVASSSPTQLAEVVKQRVPQDYVLELEGLPAEQLKALVRQHLALRDKRLPGEFVERLLDDSVRTDTRLPLYLLVAVEELCLFGSHEKLGARIANLPPTLPALLGQVLNRLEQDHGYELVRAACSWLAVAQAGLTEPEMLDLLSRNLPAFRPIEWSWLYKAMQMYLYAVDGSVSNESHGGVLGFFVDQLRSVVFRRYLAMPSGFAEPTAHFRAAHNDLASYFQTAVCPDGEHWQSARLRALAALPHHLLRAGRESAAVGVHLNYSFLSAKTEAGLLFDLVRDLGETAQVASSGEAETLRLIERAMRSEIQFLARHPRSLFQTLWNYSVNQAEGGEAGGNGFRLLMKSWRARKERDEPGFSWIRSLLPSLAGSAAATQTTLRGHQHVVFSIAFSPDGSLVASGSRDNTVRVWDVETGSERAVLSGHLNQVQSVAFLDNQRVLSGSGNPEMSEGKVIGEADYTVRLWSIPDEVEIVRSPEHGGMIHAVAAARDGRHVVSGDSKGTLRIWPAGEWSKVRTVQAHQSSIRRIIYTATNILSFASNGEIGIWEPGTLARGRTLSVRGNIWAAALSPNATRMAIAHGCISVLDAETGAELQRIDAPGAYGVAWSVDGKLLAGGLGDGSVRLWDADAGAEVRRFVGHEGPVTCVAVAPGGRHFASGSMDGTVRLWTFGSEAGPALPVRHEATVLCIHPSRSDLVFVSASEDKTAIVWDARRGASRSRLEGHTHSVTCAALINADSQAVTGSYDDTVRFWDCSTGKALASFPGKCMGPRGIALSPDGRTVAFAALDGSVQALDTETRELRSKFLYAPDSPSNTMAGTEGTHAPRRGLVDKARDLLRGRPDEKKIGMAEQKSLRGGIASPLWIAQEYSADGSTFAAGGLTHVAVWDVKTTALRASFEPPPGLFCLAISPAGDKVAAGGLGNIHLWDVSTRARLHSLEGHGHIVSFFAFSLDGRMLVSASEDGSARVWSVSTGRSVGVIDGAGDVANLAGASRYIDRTHVTGETSFFSSSSGRVAGWYPGIVGTLRALSDGVSWAGMTRTGQIYILRVEGAEAPATSLAGLGPLLTRYWRGAVYHHLRNGDRAKAEDTLRYREEVCKEIADIAGLTECAYDRRRINPPPESTAAGKRRLESKFEEVQTAMKEDDTSHKLAKALEELKRLGRELGELEAVRVALLLEMHLEIQENDDAKLLRTLEDLSEINMALGDAEQLINILGTRAEVLQRAQELAEAVKITFQMEHLARPLSDMEVLVKALRLRLSLCRSANDWKGALDAARLITQAGYDSEDLIVTQAGLSEQAFLHMDMQETELAMRAFDTQERICRRLGDPERLAVCLINTAVVGGRDPRIGLQKAKEAQTLIEGHDLSDLKRRIGPVLEYLKSLSANVSSRDSLEE
jgi:WD40 repeat protein